jgi:hypothetical protein
MPTWNMVERCDMVTKFDYKQSEPTKDGGRKLPERVKSFLR